MALRLIDGITLYIARQGETVANVESRFQGRTIDTPLTPQGIRQAQAIGSIMRREMGTRACAAVSSPLKRAQSSMELALTSWGRPADAYSVDERIVEIDLGSWDGLTKAEARAVDPAAYDAREADKWNVRSLCSRESYADVAARATSWIGDLSQDTFAVSHGAFTRILRGLFLGLTWKQMSDLDEPQGCVFRVHDSAVTRLDA